MRKIFVVLVVNLFFSFYATPVFADFFGQDETLQTCITDIPFANPARDVACMSIVTNASESDLKPYMTAAQCTPDLMKGAKSVACLAPLTSCKTSIALAAQCGIYAVEKVEELVCSKGPRDCCISDEKSDPIAIADGVCKNEFEKCKEGGDIHYSCCVCDVPIEGDPKPAVRKVSDGRDSYDTCLEKCQAMNPKATVNMQVGAGPRRQASAKATKTLTLAQMQAKNATCFTIQECVKPEYGGTQDAFRPGYGCPKGEGRCIAPEPEITLSFPIGKITTVKGLRNFMTVGFNYLVSVVGVAASVMFVYGGFRYIVGSAFMDIKRGKEIMVDSAVGLMLVLGSVTIMSSINKDTLDMTRLEVFMINKQQIMSSRFCADIKSDSIKFAEAGSGTDIKPINEVLPSAYTAKAKETRCNYEYYAESFGDSRCAGSKCDQLDEACLSCKGGGCSTGVTTNYECKKTSWAGNIAYTDNRYATALVPVVVCKDALNKGVNDYDGSQNAMFEMGTKTSPEATDKQGETGAQRYSFDIDEDDLAEAESDCKSLGGITGFLMGVQYHHSAIAADDYLIIGGQKNCGSGAFSAYMDADATGFKMTDIKRAIWCGIYETKELANPSNYFTVDQVKNALVKDIGTRPIICNISLGNPNAPPNPVQTNKFMAGCTGRASELNTFDKFLDYIVN